MVFRRRPPAPPDPLEAVRPELVPPEYRPAVADALRARAQFTELVGSMRAGAFQDRLRELAERVDAGVMAVWRTVEHAGRLEGVIATLEPERTTAELKQARRDGADAAVIDALTTRFVSTQRLLNALGEMRDQLPVLEARLGTAVARAAELVLTSSIASAPAELDALGRQLDELTSELQALGAAAAEIP